MEFMTLVRRTSVALAAGLGLWLLPATAFAETSDTTTVTLPPAPTLTVPVLPVPTIPSASSSTGGSLTVPTLTVPQLQVPSLAVPSLTVPTLTVPQLQVPSLTVPVLQVPAMPALTLPPAAQTGVAAVDGTPVSPRAKNGKAPAVAQSVQLQSGLISPEVLLEMLNAAEESSVIELTPPQDATTTNRLPIGTFAAIGGGTALISAALSLLRRRRVEETATTESAA